MSDIATAALVLALVVGLAAASAAAGFALVRLRTRGPVDRLVRDPLPPQRPRDEDDEDVAALYHS